MHGVFDIIGPVMIGPSSSHTAGAVRLGLIARKILGEDPVDVRIKLHGSFAHTYRGHGTDKALIAGIMGFSTDDERIRYALKIARQSNICYEFQTVDLGPSIHPNTAVITLTGINGRQTKLIGSSIGGGNIMITNIDGYEVELTGQYATLITVHHDRPGVITKVTSILAKHKINVAFMRVSRKRRGEEALMILEVDEVISDTVVDETQTVDDVNHSFAIPPI